VTHRLTLLALLVAAPLTSPATDQVATRPSASARVATAEPAGHAHDRLQLDATAVTGNRELPKVMSIVPWKGAEPPGGPDRPMGSLIEEVLAPVDRDEFQREITYFRDLTSQSVPKQPITPSSSPGATQP
jgi:hypothetical protein